MRPSGQRMSRGEISAFWERFLRSPAAQKIADLRLYDTMRVGSSPIDADHGAALILAEEKTATSSHPSEYGEHPGRPFVGALSIVLDGSDRPIAVVETLEVHLRKLSHLDEAFARDYGEWDKTAKTLKAQLEAY